MGSDERRSAMTEKSHVFFFTLVASTTAAERSQRPNLIGSIRLNLDRVTFVLSAGAAFSRLGGHGQFSRSGTKSLCQPFYSTLQSASLCLMINGIYSSLVHHPASAQQAVAPVVFFHHVMCFEVIPFRIFIHIATKLRRRADAFERNPRRGLCHKDKCCLTPIPPLAKHLHLWARMRVTTFPFALSSTKSA